MNKLNKKPRPLLELRKSHSQMEKIKRKILIQTTNVIHLDCHHRFIMVHVDQS